MSEIDYALTFPLRFIPSILFAWAYVLGGREGISLIVRRGIGLSLLVVSSLLLSLLLKSFSWWLLPCYIPLALGLTTGYGADETIQKMFVRLRFGAFFGATSICLGFVTGELDLGFIQGGLAILTSLVFGVFNPYGSRKDGAVLEEGAIAFLSTVLLCTMI